MTKRDLAILGCKILGILIFIRGIFVFLVFSLPSILNFIDGELSGNNYSTSAIPLLTWIIVMVCSAVFWLQAKRISQWMVPEDTPPASFALHEDFIVAALLLIGVVLLVVSIPVCVQYFAEHLFATQNITASNSFNTRNLVEAYFQFILGIIILGSSANISRFFRYSTKSTFPSKEQEPKTAKHDIAHLGCKLLGIYLIVINAVTLTSRSGTLATTFWQQNNGLSPFMMAAQIEAIFYFAMIIVIGVWLWLGADSFARKLTGKKSSDVAVDLNLAILPLMISFVGLILLVKAVPGFINDISLQCIKAHYFPASDAVFGYNAIAAGAKVLLGLLLFCAPDTVSAKLQNMGPASASTIASLKRWIKNPSDSNVNR